ncbi:MAG: vWA domain-containing protein, partial [Casimicrobium sp.]
VSELVDLKTAIPEDWLKKIVEKMLSPEERAKLEAMDFETLMETLKKRLEEQQGRHQGGNKWIGTGGTSPFGAYGDNPAGIRIGQKESRMRSAVKVWDERQFRDYDDNVDFNTRNINVALRRLRRFAREGAVDELDLPHTLEETGKNAGMLSIQMRPERRNAVKVLLLLDIGGSMDDHIEQVEALFSAAKSEFKRLEHFYFHNCLYDFVWKTNRRRSTERTLTMDLLHKYGPDYRVIFVGDAAMSPYEIEMDGGSVEYMNSESGRVWLGRVVNHFKRVAWLNPMPQRSWEYTYSTDLIKKIVGDRMYPTTVNGLTEAMKVLAK